MARSRSDQSPFRLEDVQVVKKETPFKGYFQIDRYHFTHPKYEGGRTETFTREIFERGHASAMLPYDPVADRLILIEQFRPGAFAANYNPWMIEIPAGIVDKGETPEQVAIRETHEETGCVAKRIEFVADFLLTQGGSSETAHLYCVEIDVNDASQNAGLAHEAEDIRVLNVSVDEAFQWLEEGRIHNASAMLALYWFKLNILKIRDKWCG